MVQTKTLVTGANGMLGTALCNTLRKHGYKVMATDINVNGGNIQYLDVTDRAGVMAALKKFQPAMVFHLAAETDVDKCEQEVEHAYLVNTMGTENVALACQQTDLLMIYISTAAVFDGTKPEPYTEFDNSSPVNVYAKTKLEGERIVERLLNKYFIIRAGWMIGGGRKDKKFVAKIVELLSQKKELLAVNDKFGSPTFTEDMVECMLPLINTARFGTYHMANKGACSRYEIACRILEYMGKEGVVIKPVSSAFFPLPAPRSRSETLDNFKLRLSGMDNMRPWQQALEAYLEKLLKE